MKFTSRLDFCTRLANSHPNTWWAGKTSGISHPAAARAGASTRFAIRAQARGQFLDIDNSKGVSALSRRHFSRQ